MALILIWSHVIKEIFIKNRYFSLANDFLSFIHYHGGSYFNIIFHLDGDGLV